MKKLFTILLILLASRTFSQEILLEQNVLADSVKPGRGPNLKNFVHPYVGLGFPLYTSEEISYTKTGSSTRFDFGLRYKRKFCNTFAMGMDLGLNTTGYKIKQNDGKTMPDTLINKKEKFQLGTATVAVFARINVGRRGNYIGNYLDIGAYGSWNMAKKHKTTNKNGEGEKIRVLTTRLTYFEEYSYGLLGRIGTNRYALTASYRLSDIFKSSYTMPELPRLIVGVEVGLFK